MVSSYLRLQIHNNLSLYCHLSGLRKIQTFAPPFGFVLGLKKLPYERFWPITDNITEWQLVGLQVKMHMHILSADMVEGWQKMLQLAINFQYSFAHNDKLRTEPWAHFV